MLFTRALAVLFAACTYLESAAAQNNQPLLPLLFNPLPLGSIKASGWLLNELKTEAEGLAGHEHDFYIFVSDSSWVGGSSEYSGLNEAFPYWFNGLVPLAYSLDDERLKGQVHLAAQQVLDHQQADGWIGPETGNARNFWARYPAFLGFTNLVDANASWEKPVLDALKKFYPLMSAMLADDYRGYKYHSYDTLSEQDTTWGRVRYMDLLITLMWVLEKYPDGQEQLLLDNMNFLHNGSLDWAAWYNEAVYIKEDLSTLGIDDSNNPLFPYEHGVNVGQGLKAPAVVRRLTHNDSLIQTAMDAVNWTFTYHGAPSGTVLADERLMGLNPWTGSELCTAVETMYSLNYLYQALGTAYYADRAELTTFNALPAMLTPDWWGHQYVAQPNQPFAKPLNETPFWNVGTYGTTFGLEPNYPCCTANHPQGLPKFLMATYVKTSDGNGIVNALLSPASVSTELNGTSVTINSTTNYPFSNLITYSISASTEFDFYVRVPGWATSKSNIAVNTNAPTQLLPDKETGLHQLRITSGSSTVVYRLDTSIRTENRLNDTIAIYYGALLYALEVNFTTSTNPPHIWNDPSKEFPNAPAESHDWYYSNSTAWNYAVDPSTLVLRSSVGDGEPEPALPNPIWASGASPLWIEAKACKIDWGLYKGVPGVPPVGSERKCLGPVETVKLVPYGGAKVHMAQLPTLDLS